MSWKSAFVLASAVTFTAPGLALADSCLKLPIDNTWITSHFGVRTIHGVVDGHHGIDLHASERSVVKAPDDLFVNASVTTAGACGKLLQLKSSSGRIVKFCHLSQSTDSAPGAKVQAGEVVAYSGHTGFAKADKTAIPAHLHFQVEQPLGAYVDPEALLCGGTAPSRTESVLGDSEFANSPPDATFDRGEPGPAGPPEYGLDGGSLYQIVADVIASRATNPDYPRTIATLSNERLYAEVAYVRAVALRVRMEINAHKERIEAINAAKLALKVEKVLAPRLQAAGANAEASAANTR